MEDWDETTQRVRKKSPINSALNEVEREVQDAYNFLKYHNKPLTMLALKLRMKGENAERMKFVDFIDNHYEKYVIDNVVGFPVIRPAIS